METRERPTHKIATFLTAREAEQMERLARDADRSVSAEVRLVLRRHLTNKFPVSLTRADPGTESKARDATKAARQAWDRKNPELDLDGFRRAP